MTQPSTRLFTAALRALLTLVAALFALGTLAVPAAQAAGTPNLSLGVDADERTLHGTETTVRLTASSPLGQPQGYNLSYRAQLPAGVSYVGGSASPAPRILNDSPTPGLTTLIWANVADISPNSTNELAFSVAHDPVLQPVGTTFTITAGAYAQTDPRLVPRFTAAGLPIPASYTGSATGADDTELIAVEIEKTEPSPESELLRGIHDHQTTYTLEYRNNGISPTEDVVIDDYLPAALEFLGCGGADNTTDAPTNPGSTEEYPGSGPITVPAVGGCLAPALVETLVGIDPDGAGPLPVGTYTHVRWSIPGQLNPGDSGSITYAAAIPIRANAGTWTGPEPTPGSLDQAINLDNNSGPETSDETSLINGATISGNYNGTTPVSDSDTHQVSAEDVRILKSGSSTSLQQGAITTWTLRIDTSEYRWATGITVTDTVPSGLCPLGTINHANAPDGQDAECDPVGGQLPSIPYTSATENANGTYTVVWDPAAIGPLDSSSTRTLTFPTRTRVNYQNNFQNTTPILDNDAIENTVALAATANTICSGGATPQDCAGPATLIDTDFGPSQAVVDASEAGQVAGSPTLRKRVAQSSTNCTADTYVSTVPSYRPGDRVCWELRIDYPTNLDTAGLTANDFLPEADTHDATLNGNTGQAVGPSDTLPGTTFDNTDAVPGPGGTLVWNLASGLVQPSNIFERYTASRVGLPLASAADPAEDGTITSNLFKASVTNTAGVSFPLRDDADYELIRPELSLNKQIVGLNSVVLTPFRDSLAVNGNDDVTFGVTITNTGSIDADNVEIWDNLPAQTSCAAVGAISDGGVCAGGRISWGASPATGPTVPAGGSITLIYDVSIPDDVFDPTEAAVNTAGIRKFESPVNTGGVFTYYPDNNIDATVEPLANVEEARDTAQLTGQALTITKARTSPSDGANNAAAQATIGEIVTYTVDVVLGPNMSIANAVISDPNLNATTHPLIAGTATGTLGGGALPGGFTVTETGGVPAINFPAAYTSGAVEETFQLTFQARITDVAGNAAGGVRNNRARVVYDDPNAAGSLTLQSAQIATTVVEPRIGINKTDNVSPASVSGGQVVTYTLAITNGPGSASPVSRAHGLRVSDLVPTGVTPVDFTTELPLADGASTGTAPNGVWDLATRTILWDEPAAIVEPGGSTNRSYKVRVNDPPTGGAALTNTVDVTTSSMAGNVAGERSGAVGVASRYWARDTNTLTAASASIAKSSSPDDATIGSQVTYTLNVTIPASVQLFDVTVVDTLPANIDFDGHVSQTCTAGCPPNIPTQQYTPVTNASTQTIAWDLGDIASHTQARNVRLIYTGHVRATNRGSGTNVINSNTSVNQAVVSSNLADSGVPFNPAAIPATFDLTSPIATDTVTIREPAVSMDKQVRINGGAWTDGPADVTAGDALEYRIVVENTSATWPLYDVTVDDLPDADLTNVVPTTGAGNVTDGWTSADRDLRWLIPGPIAPGATVTLAYTADPNMATVGDGDAITNTARVASSYGVSGTDRTANPTWTYRPYTTPDDTVTLNFASPDISIVKTTGVAGFPDSAAAQIGQNFSWRVVVTNNSSVADATQVRVVDTLPRDWEYVSGSASFAPGGALEPTISAQPTGDVLTWATSFNLAAGASITLTFNARPEAASQTSIGTGGGNPHVNSASASVRDEDGNTSDGDGLYEAGPDTADAVLAVPVLTIAKTPDGTSLPAGSTATYSILVSNTGSVPARNVIVDDTIPTGTTYTAGTATAAPSTGFSETDGSGPSLQWAITQIPAGGAVTITLNLATDPAAAAGTTLTNTASADSDETLTPVTDTGTYVLTTVADLVASKSATPNPATAGQALEYTIGVENLGPSVARDVTLTDTLPLTVTLGATPLPAGCTYDAGTRTITCVIGDLAVGATASRVIDVDVIPGATGNASNTVTASTTTTDPVSPNDEATVSVPIGTTFDLSVTKTTLDTPILNGETGRFRLAVANAGPSTATAVTVTDTIPAGLTYVSDDAGCSYAAPTLTCVVGVVDTNDTPEITVTVRGNTVGTHTNSASVTGTGTESDPSNNTDTSDMQVLPATDLRLEKSAPSTVAAGGTLAYDLTVTNDGPDPATGVSIEDTLPAGVIFQSADAGCTAAGQTVTCAIGALASGANETRQITVQVPISLGTQTLTNTAVTSGNEGDPTPGNNTDDAVTTVGPAADLAVVKSGPASIDQGGNITWTIVVTNNGPSTATDVEINDPLPAGTALVATQPSQGTCGTTDPLECDLGSIPAGGTAQVLVTASTDRGLGGSSITNRVTVDGAEPDVDPSNNSSEVVTAISLVPFDSARLSIVKTVSGTPAFEQPLTYTLAVRNDGPSASTNTVVTDALPAGLVYQSSTTTQGTCAHANGTVTCQLGTLPNGGTATVTVVAIPTVTGELRNFATVRGDQTDGNPADNQGVALAAVQRVATSLRITKKLSQKRLKAGGSASYKLKVTNRGRVTALNVRVCDDLPRELTLRSRSGGRIIRGQLCFTIDRLAAGKSKTYTVKVRVSRTTRSSRVTNRASAVADNASRVRARVSSPLQRVAGVRTSGLTG